MRGLQRVLRRAGDCARRGESPAADRPAALLNCGSASGLVPREPSPRPGRGSGFSWAAGSAAILGSLASCRGIFSEDQVIEIVQECLGFYKERSRHGERLHISFRMPTSPNSPAAFAARAFDTPRCGVTIT